NAMRSMPGGGFIAVKVMPDADGAFRVEVSDQRLSDFAARTEPRYPAQEAGMALAKYLVELQGGRVGVRSAPDQGNITYAVLPGAADVSLAKPALRIRESLTEPVEAPESSLTHAVPVIVSSRRRTA